MPRYFIYLPKIKFNHTHTEEQCNIIAQNETKTPQYIMYKVHVQYTTNKALSRFWPGLFNALLLVLVHEELCGLSRRVNDQGVPVEPLQHDGVLSTQVISWQGIGRPSGPLIRIGQVLKHTQGPIKMCVFPQWIISLKVTIQIFKYIS